MELGAGAIILLLDLFPPLGLTDPQATILFAPSIEGLLGHADRTHGLARYFRLGCRGLPPRVQLCNDLFRLGLLPMVQLDIRANPNSNYRSVFLVQTNTN